MTCHSYTAKQTYCVSNFPRLSGTGLFLLSVGLARILCKLNMRDMYYPTCSAIIAIVQQVPDTSHDALLKLPIIVSY